ncbi:AtzE family amidohydrolase [Novosphingobium sp. YJ-S2-02]|uniref:AtzE family amidohydrolase n=1 Tax=Novosphingobium aureum TaxID=2792964 RepID=A0A931HF31_9SPHN|nr:AtzE family amidohydrolase [Novosphingobium aureum]MBH0114950.1 AtzE family amidohydrolase [Novosphingobium aureum]
MRSALEIAHGVRHGMLSAVAVTEQCLAALEERAGPLVAVTRVLSERARDEARRVDAMVARGEDPGPLAGVPYGVKDLFDVAGIATSAGSAIFDDAPAAGRDAEAVERLRAAGGVLVATLNMDEFAYGFATINARHGTTRNPHDPSRLAGGSSGGSAAMVAAGLMPFSLGSDTNGSVRVPASLCGLYGLKPTHGALPLEGVFPFAESFDDVGPFTGSIADMVLLWEVLTGGPASAAPSSLKVARLGGRFRDNADPAQLAAMDSIARAMDSAAAPLVIPDIARARSAAFVITACEGGRLHRETLARAAMSYDPQVRDRLLAGALLPEAIYEEAQAFRARYKAPVLDLIADHDVLLAPATPCTAPSVADPRIEIDGAMSAARADLGIHTQAITFLGLPSLAVPLRRPGQLPLGLQLIGRPGCEGTLFAFAKRLEDEGFIGVTVPEAFPAGALAGSRGIDA